MVDLVSLVGICQGVFHYDCYAVVVDLLFVVDELILHS